MTFNAYTFARSPARAVADTPAPGSLWPEAVRACRPTLFNGVALAGFVTYAVALPVAIWVWLG